MAEAKSWPIREIGADEHPTYASIPALVDVTSALRVVADRGGLGGLRLLEEPLEEAYVKSYDDGHSWIEDLDVSRWGIFMATDVGHGDALGGGATVAVDGPIFPVKPFQREDLAVLWDLRVHPRCRRRGIGSALFRHAAAWARSEGYRQLGIETQNVNVAACRFYARLGCRLGAIHRYGYAGCPKVAHEAMLLWYLEL